MNGIWAAVLTPFDAKLAPDATHAAEYYNDLLRRGCDGINLLGTTGEAMSLSAEQRLRFMEAIADAIPVGRGIVGTGAASLDDAARLTSGAFACGFSAALVLPPFFYREASDDGIVAFFDALVSRTSPPDKALLLYNFPRMSGITFRPDLVDRLLREFPGVIGGMKDSSNDAQFQAKILSRHAEFAIFPGSEHDLRSARSRGVAGCISGSVALWATLARDVLASGDSAKAQALDTLRAALDGVPFIPAMRYLTARVRRDAAWEHAMPPLMPLGANQRRALDRALEPFWHQLS